MKLSEASKGFLLMRATEFSPATIDIYRWALEKRLMSFLGDIEVDQITETDLLRFFTYLRNEYKPNRKSGETSPLKPRSIENAWTAIRSFYNWATMEFGLKNRPDKNVRRPRYRPAEIVPFSQEEIIKLIKACERTSAANTNGRASFTMRRKSFHRDVSIILTLLDSGVRVSECARLRIKDANIETGEVFVQPYGTDRKTKSRLVYLGKSARKALWRYLAEREDPQPNDPLFVTMQDKPMDRNSIRLLLADLGKRAGVNGVHPHKFRHSFAVQYLRNGGDVFSLKRLLGHSSLEMTEHYLAIAQSDLAQGMRNSSPADRWRL